MFFIDTIVVTDLQAAIDCYRRALEIDPEDTRAFTVSLIRSEK